jgi:GntR family transcriptional regulator
MHMEPSLFILKPHSGVPIYRQLTEQIRRMVASGRLTAGAELPSIRDLALQHAINPMTVSKAYSLLEGEGLLERRRGRPMRVAAENRETAPLAARVRELDQHLDNLVLAGRQLELNLDEVTRALREKWEKIND